MDKKYKTTEKLRNKSKDHHSSTDKTQINSIERYLVQKPARESKPKDESSEACTSRNQSMEGKGKREKESEVGTEETTKFKSKVSSDSEDKPKPNKSHGKSRHRAGKKKDSKSSKKTDHSKTNNNTLKDYITINPSTNKSSHDKTKDSKSGSSTKSKSESKSKESTKSKDRGERSSSSSSSRKSRDEKTCKVFVSTKFTVKKRPSDPDQEQENNDKKRKTKSFLLNKHGDRIPRTEDILKEREDIARNKKLIEELDNLPTVSTDFLSKLDKIIDEEDMEIHDCKHLTPEQLETYFIKYQSFLEDIISGKENCERHRRFYDPKLKGNGPEFNNISIMVYDFHQMHSLLKLMEQNCSIKDDIYIFHVLLPELCLKIFMDVHQMSLQQATEYLRKCPIE